MAKRVKKPTSPWDWYNTHPGKLFSEPALDESEKWRLARMYKSKHIRASSQEAFKGSRLG